MVYVLLFVSIDFQNVSASWLFLFIAIKRQWCLECILKIEGFAKTIDFLLRSDLHSNNELLFLLFRNGTKPLSLAFTVTVIHGALWKDC